MESIITASACAQGIDDLGRPEVLERDQQRRAVQAGRSSLDLLGILGTRARLAARRRWRGRRRPPSPMSAAASVVTTPSRVLAQEEQVEDPDGAVLDELQDGGRDAPAELVAREADDVDVDRPDCHARSLIGIDDLLAFGGMPAHADARERDPMRSCRRAGDEPPSFTHVNAGASSASRMARNRCSGPAAVSSSARS